MILSDRSTVFVTTRPERAYAELVTAAPSVISVRLDTTGIPGAGHVHAIMPEANKTIATEHCAVAMNSASASAK